MKPWKVACIQLDIEFGNPEKNFLRASDKIAEAASSGAEIIVLPELWTTGYDLTRLEEIGDSNAKRSIDFLRKEAIKHRIHLIGGSVANQKKDGVYNTLLVIDKGGNLLKQYDKLHLFKLMDEHKFLRPGQSDGLFQLDQVPCAGFICYDIRFPEWIRTHTAKGAEVLFVVAEWPLPRLAHWRALLISRAIENQAFVVACNRSGSDPHNTFAGHSMVINPWGDILAESSEDESILYADLSFDKTPEIRKQIPIFQDRRPEFYL
ncbi:carbon-nitrogen family hydrolase [Peribacillus tepidiphilus]|uniref:carbon-nitrogen family hydrolase n=1 Tax=Peribacillus tepidiphilus TaxID=2652445 RepID=UPI0012913A87|nr:carbon-nitrogen family hydrolase [Peribacillus tepidiphilus]